jgi:enamine deaminase RidA (YjgF/YER057c/UK114 family)
MTRRRINTGSPFERFAGYSRAVVDGDFCFVSGTTGYDYASMQMPEDVEAQTRNCFATIRTALEDAGFSFAEVVRARYYLVDAADADRVLRISGEMFADVQPAATLVVVVGLLRPEMKVEIEVTAKRMTEGGRRRTDDGRKTD